MSLLLLFKGGVAVAPPVGAPTTIPTPVVEIDFLGNPTATYADIHRSADGAVSFWRMNSLTTLLDERAVNNGVMVSTPATIAGPHTYDTDLGLTFDGANDSAYVPDSLSTATSGACSIDGWVRVAALPGSTKDLVCKQGAFRLQLTSAGKLLWTLVSNAATVVVTSNSVLAVNTWYHVTAVYDGAAALLYVNGVLDSSSAYSSGLGIAGQPIRFAGSAAQTAPTWQSSTTNTGNDSFIVGTKPGSTASGDLLIAHICISSTTGGFTVTPPSGWVLRSSQVPYIIAGLPGAISQVYTRIATASEPASWGWIISQNGVWAAAVSRITGQDTLAPIEAVYGSVQTTNVTDHSTGSHYGGTENNLVFSCFYGRGNVTWTQSSGTERYDAGTFNNIAACTQSQATIASLDVNGISSSAVLGAAHTLIIVGSGVNETACSLDDWTYWNRDLSALEIARNYYAKDSGTGTWTDVSASVRSLNIMGSSRQYELDQMEAGTSGVVLNDINRSFDPANSSSTYSPNVIPMRKIRGRTTYQGTVYDLFYAYIERWPPQNAVPGYQEIGLNAVDGFDALALAQVSGTLGVGFSGAQINALLDKALWPRDARAIDVGQYVMAGQTLNGGALGLIQEIADSERGIFFLDQAGVATFHDSAHRGSFSRSTVSQVTFVDNESGSGVPYHDLSPSFDKDRVINEWTVVPDSSVFGSAAQQQIDSLSVTRYWRRSGQRSTKLVSNADALAQAGNLLNETSQPAQRFDSITVLPTTVAGYQACLGLYISDRVTVRRGDGPSWDGAVLQKDCFIEAKHITATPSVPWTFTFALSPVSLGNYYGTIVRDGPVSYWRMDTL